MFSYQFIPFRVSALFETMYPKKRHKFQDTKIGNRITAMIFLF